ncbi:MULTISPECIES: universal stress protein [Streptomyces]|uniref:Universal stress protein n=1 Tax=Streptomyces lasalocidi TaxID=324833 RepID=A0A4U5WB33_STRLS|nr:universal stress protein [Streptomyces lasalocidi]TKS98926.1 universal stress protein [Streptomyces lasalocidi]WTI49097.1 universal stress protein [Streptomyces longwoodensis]WUC75368.1 universal stress protein [Streptomyces longwoodensis]
MFQRILLAVDSGPAGRPVVRLAGDLARLTGARARVVHVAASSATLAAVVPLEDDAEAKLVLDEAVTSLRDAGVEADGVVARALTTQIAAAVSAAAEEWNADLIVLSPHHRGALEALISPRVSDAVAHSTRAAVLLAPEDTAGH